MEDINFAFHPQSNRFDWYEREFIRLTYKMQAVVNEERDQQTRPRGRRRSRSTKGACEGGESEHPRVSAQ